MTVPEHEKLEVYHKALDAAERLEGVARAIPPLRADMADQLRRAALSIPLNIAEGANEFSPAEKARFYRIARRSAGESQAVLDVAARILATPPPTEEAKRALQDVVAMLTKLILAHQRRR